jgi:hypothetical protein
VLGLLLEFVSKGIDDRGLFSVAVVTIARAGTELAAVLMIRRAVFGSGLGRFSNVLFGLAEGRSEVPINGRVSRMPEAVIALIVHRWIAVDDRIVTEAIGVYAIDIVTIVGRAIDDGVVESGRWEIVSRFRKPIVTVVEVQVFVC